MFGKDNLLSAGFRTAAVAQFEAELAIAREARAARCGMIRAAVWGVCIGLAVAAVMMIAGVA